MDLGLQVYLLQTVRSQKLLVIYGDRDPGDVIHKMNTRKDKYDISGKVHIREGEEKIHAMMEDYEGVIIWIFRPRSETGI